MESKMKNRLALLSILLVAGLLMAGIGTALGTGNLLTFAGKEVSASVTTNEDGTQAVIIREDGKVVKEVALPEGSEGSALSIKSSPDGEMVISQVSDEEIEENCNKPGFHCVTKDSGEPASGVSCFINGQQKFGADCPKPK
jgi:hypothetical protein